MIYKAGAGPEPIDHKVLTVKNLSEAIKFAMSPRAKEAAQNLANKIREEVGFNLVNPPNMRLFLVYRMESGGVLTVSTNTFRY